MRMVDKKQERKMYISPIFWVFFFFFAMFMLLEGKENEPEPLFFLKKSLGELRFWKAIHMMGHWIHVNVWWNGMAQLDLTKIPKSWLKFVGVDAHHGSPTLNEALTDQ